MGICYSLSWHANYSFFMAWIHYFYIYVPHSFSSHYLCIVKEEFELEKELERVEEDCERQTWRVRVELGEPMLIQCVSVDSVEGKVDSVCTSTVATNDLYATSCSNLGELTHSLDLSLYFVSLLNN